MAQISAGLRSLEQYLDNYDAPKRKSDDLRAEEAFSSPSKKAKREEGERTKSSSEKERRKEKKAKRSRDHEKSSKKQGKSGIKAEPIPEAFYEDIG